MRASVLIFSTEGSSLITGPDLACRVPDDYATVTHKGQRTERYLNLVG
jgi:hypothetical protein